MENLRKRVGELQLDKNFVRKTKEEEDEEEKPLLKAVLEQTTDKDFIIDCLCWHNEYRARHCVPAMSISMKLCVSAQEWANHLASRNEIYYCPARVFNFGQNIFCCVETCLMQSISGQEVATYWYASMKRYDFFKRPSLLHTTVNVGHFTQIVWKNTKYMGVGKSVSKTGKIFVVGELFKMFFFLQFYVMTKAFHFSILLSSRKPNWRIPRKCSSTKRQQASHAPKFRQLKQQINVIIENPCWTFRCACFVTLYPARKCRFTPKSSLKA